MTPDRIRAKASSLVSAWRQAFGNVPTLTQVWAALCPAMHETVIGDAGGTWTGEDNWGATTLPGKPGQGMLSADELAVLKANGMAQPPDPRSTAPAKVEAAVNAARFALKSNGKRWKGLHVDTSTHPYWVFFYVPKDDVDGARYYLRGLMAGDVPAAVASGDLDTLAAQMYRNGYFYGVHVPHDHGGPNDVANVSAYAQALHAVAGTIRSALGSFDPSNPGPVAQRVPIPEPTPVPLVTSAAADQGSPPSPSQPPQSAQDSPPTDGCDAICPGDDVLDEGADETC